MIKYEITFNKLLARIKNGNAIFGELLVFCSVCLDQLQTLHTQFMSWGSFEKAKLDHTGSKISTEAYLNDQFDFWSRRIWIETLNRLPLRYIMAENEEPDMYLFTDGDPYMNYIYTDQDYVEGGRIDLSFVVWVPTDIMYRKDEIRSVVDFYRMHGKSYIIRQFGNPLDNLEDVNLTFN